MHHHVPVGLARIEPHARLVGMVDRVRKLLRLQADRRVGTVAGVLFAGKRAALLRCRGIGEKRLADFNATILDLVAGREPAAGD